jgi:adenine-specific DNA-methyltransferase
MNIQNELLKVLFKDKRLILDKKLSKNKVIELSLKLDSELLGFLLESTILKDFFFVQVGKHLIFDKVKFQHFVANKEFLPDSFTTFKNKIGLTSNNEYFSDSQDVVLSFPYKDCVLEGGQTKEDSRREEIFWNEILAPDQIDRLFEPKVFDNFVKFDGKGEHKLDKVAPEDNLLIRGNNLLALHSLKRKFKNQIKLIYIDPPYNTGSDSFLYNDKFNHSTWLTFMKNRLEVANDLLKSNGVIFIHIDYIEQAYLKILCDEVFGRESFVQMISVKTATPAGFKVVNPGPVNVTEFILMYAMPEFKHKKLYTKCGYQKDYRYVIEDMSIDYKKWKIVDRFELGLNFERGRRYLKEW